MGDKGNARQQDIPKPAEAMQKENFKLQQRIVKLEAELISARNHIRALVEERGKIILGQLSDAALLDRQRTLERQLAAKKRS